MTAVQAEGDAGDRVVLRADHHGRHDEDLRVRHDADRADEPGDDEEQVEGRRIGPAGPDAGLQGGPQRCLEQRAGLFRRDPVGAPREHHVDVVHGDRPRTVHAQPAQPVQHLARGALRHVALDRVTAADPGRAQDHEVQDAVVRGEQVDGRPGEGGRHDHPEVDQIHPRPPVRR
ncbi:hypothetical protein [Streptomyces collinus]|uniref:hypothetical protein n=1 Tax=Streptomyces collinus TaxID=42684 RepID=UPI003642855E